MAPPHKHRVYLYAGGLGEAWNWPHAGVSEVANDLNGYLINFYRVLKDPRAFKELQRLLSATPFSRIEWEDANATMVRLMAKTRPEAFDPAKPDPKLAALFFVWNRQSMAGRMDTFSPLTKTRTRGGRNAEVNSWWSGIEALPEVRERLDHFVVEHMDAVKLGKKEDKKDTLFYADPTYVVSETRGEGRSTADVYAVETTGEMHEQLIEWLAKGIKGKMMLSGYRNKLYDGTLTPERGWRRLEKKIDNKAQKGEVKRSMTEALWVNF